MIDMHKDTDTNLRYLIEQEDQDKSKAPYCHYSFPRNYDTSLTGSQRSACVCQPADVSSVLQDCVTERRADIPTMQGRARGKDAAARPVSVFNCANFKARHNAWSQTQKGTEDLKKSSVAIQCDILQACSCQSEMSSLQSAETVTSTGKGDTTGGQNIPSISAFK